MKQKTLMIPGVRFKLKSKDLPPDIIKNRKMMQPAREQLKEEMESMDTESNNF